MIYICLPLYESFWCFKWCFMYLSLQYSTRNYVYLLVVSNEITQAQDVFCNSSCSTKDDSMIYIPGSKWTSITDLTIMRHMRRSYHFLSLSRPSYLCLKIQTCASSVPFTAIHIPLYGCTRMHISWKEFDKVRAPLQLVFFERNVQPSLLQLIFPVLLGAHRLIATKHRLL